MTAMPVPAGRPTPQPRVDAQAWLAAALAGAAPEPSLPRWQPLRVGIENLWEYDHAEFWFADGRLVLRGGNGTGKTKVLELTTLMVLRGEISPPVLDPFGSRHRTMAFNLLPTGDEDDPRPMADAGLGYAWAEFGRLDDHGTARYLVCGLGAALRRGSGTASPNRWMFTTERRPGLDLELVPALRPLEEKELRKLEGVWVTDNGARYRERLAAELFDLGPESYDNLTELLKQLRKPKLGESLNPATMASTLRDALPPLAGHEVIQLVEGWDRLDTLRTVVEQTERDAALVATFVRTGWRPWARVVVRRRADELSSATTRLDDTTKERRQAVGKLLAAQKQVEQVDAELRQVNSTAGERRTELRELLDSDPFRDAVSANLRVEYLRAEVRTLSNRRRTAGERRNRAFAAVGKAEQARGRAVGDREAAAADVRRAEQRVIDVAIPAGLAGAAERHLQARDLPALRADHRLRSERFEHVVGLRDEWRSAAETALRLAAALEEAEAAAAAAGRAEDEAKRAVEAQVERLQHALREWSAGAHVAACPPELVATWCDLAADLSDPDDPGGGLRAAVTEHLSAVRGGLAQRQQELAVRRSPLATRHRAAAAELDELRTVADSPPPGPVLWRQRDRPGPERAEGAPLWRCVQPRPGVDQERLAVLEAALAAAGLLDAWLAPDGAVYGPAGRDISDVLLGAGPAAGANTLASVLEATPTAGMASASITAVLHGIGWLPDRPRPGDRDPPAWPAAEPPAWLAAEPPAWLAADGRWRLGPLRGRAEPAQPASYLGATAREQARARAIATLETELADLAERLATIDRAATELLARLDTLAAEAEAVPSDQPLVRATATWAERGRQRTSAGARADDARRALGGQESARDNARARFAGYAAEHGFPLDGLAAVGNALAGFESTITAFEAELKRHAAMDEAVRAADETLADTSADLVGAEEALAELGQQHTDAEIKLRTAERSVSADQKQLLDRRDALDAEIAGLVDRSAKLNETLTDLKVAAGKAESVLAEYDRARATAEEARNAAVQVWWRVADAGLVAPLGLPLTPRRALENALDGARTARREINLVVDQAAEDRAWRRCQAELQELRQQLLPSRDARTGEDVDAVLPTVEVFADQATGWQPPQQAADALIARAAEQRGSYDAEQQQLLTTLLGSTFIEHLKERLDYTKITFRKINERLARHTTRHGNALRLELQPTPNDADARQVVDALGQGYQQLSTQRQDMVRAFLARRIEEARTAAADEGRADWQEELAVALDYRQWLRIQLQYRPGPSSQWRPFDAAKHASKSGGEKVVLLSQPLFAAAVVAYDAAGRRAPRMVWLDEAMTGVDEGIKASFMGLTVEFDLDIMLTAHDEWCTYPTVPAVAIYDLAKDRRVAGIDVMPYLWCGGERVQFELPDRRATSAADALATEGLFAPAEQ